MKTLAAWEEDNFCKSLLSSTALSYEASVYIEMCCVGLATVNLH